MALELHPHRLSTAEYERIVETGALAELDVELLDGLLVDMSPEGEVHVRVISRLMVLFAGRAELLRVSAPLPAGDGWMPRPDIALAAMDQADLRKRPDDALLVAEVAISSLRHDRYKAGVYARAGIPRYWLVDVRGDVVVDHTEPTRDGYQRIDVRRGVDVLDAQVDGVGTTTVSELLAGTR
jgi:Uma2 family endonuclease